MYRVTIHVQDWAKGDANRTREFQGTDAARLATAVQLWLRIACGELDAVDPSAHVEVVP